MCCVPCYFCVVCHCPFFIPVSSVTVYIFINYNSAVHRNSFYIALVSALTNVTQQQNTDQWSIHLIPINSLFFFLFCRVCKSVNTCLFLWTLNSRTISILVLFFFFLLQLTSHQTRPAVMEQLCRRACIVLAIETHLTDPAVCRLLLETPSTPVSYVFSQNLSLLWNRYNLL